MATIDFHVTWALVFQQRRKAAMAKARSIKKHCGLDNANRSEMICGWIRVARIESMNARLHFEKASACQLSLLS